jgi:hypothetical protein
MGVVVSETEMLCAKALCGVPVGLKSPGEDIGVLCAVLDGKDVGVGGSTAWSCR